MGEPLVSIACITYNQGSYIKDAIEGFLKQKTTFPVEIIIYDDASGDRTATIIRNYANEYPELIIPIYQKENQRSKGINPIVELVFPKCHGKYIAICEGDDYWTDPLKLQKQVDFLEGNPDYGMVHTDFDQLTVENNRVVKSIIKSQDPKKEWQEGKDFVKWHVGGYSKIITCTVCFRKSVFDSFVDYNEFHNPLFNKFGDHQLFCTIGGNSYVKYFDESTCIKRVLKESASHSENYLKKVDFSISISNAFEYYGKKFHVPEQYYKGYNKRFSKNLIKTAIIKHDYTLLTTGLNFKDIKFNYVQKMFFFLMFFLYKLKFIQNILVFFRIRSKQVI